MKIGKRLLSLLLCLAMLLSMLPTVVLAAEPSNIQTKDANASLPMGDKNTLTGAKPTTNVALTINSNAIVVDGTVTDATTDYVLNWNGTKYENMFVYGTNLFATLAEAQAAITPGGTILVKSIAASEAGTTFTFTVGAKYYTENYNTLPYVVGTAFDGSDWTANEYYASKAVTLGNVKFALVDADPDDEKADAGSLELYGFSFKLSGTAGISFNEMPDVRADFVFQNSAVDISGGSPTISMSTYADGKQNSKGASSLFKNFYLTGSATRVFTEYVTDYFTIDGWFVPDDFADSGNLMYLKNGSFGGKTKMQINNCNFQGWKAHMYFQMCNGMNWFAHKSDGTIPGASSDYDWRPVYITNNTFKNTSLWEHSAFHHIHANATSKTVITGNRIINTGSVVPLLKNNHARYANYFSIEMYNNYIKGYTDSPDFATDFMVGSSSVKPFADIRNNFFSDNTEANIGTTYTISKTGDTSTCATTTDWYLDENMTLLKSQIAPYEIKAVSADNGFAGVYSTANNRAIVYNLKSGNASALKFEFVTDGAVANWYSDQACTQAIDPATITAGTTHKAYVKVTIEGKEHSLVYVVHVLNSERFFASDFVDDGLLTKDMLLVSNMNDNIVASYADCQPFEYTLPTDGKTYTFVKGANAFSTLSEALAFAAANEIVTPSVYFDYSNEGESITVSHSVKIIAPNYNVKPFDDKGFSDSNKISDGTGAQAWTYNTAYNTNKRTVADFKFKGNISPAVEIYGVELKSYLTSSGAYWGTNFDGTGRATNDAPCSFVFQNILVTNAVTGMLKLSLSAGIEDDTLLVKNFYVRSSQNDGQLSLNSEYLPETTTFDGLFIDFNALGTDNVNGTRWWIKQGNSENTLTFKNCNIRNFNNTANPGINFMGKGDKPTSTAGPCKLIFDHNILYNFGTGNTTNSRAFFGFDGNGTSYESVTLTSNFISAPAGESYNLFRASDSSETTLRLTISNNIIKGLANYGLSRKISAVSVIEKNYSTKVSSTDNTISGNAIILNGPETVASKSHYLDYDMRLLNTAVEIKDVTFNKGIIEADPLKNKFTGIMKEENPGTAADFSFVVPENSEYTWYEDKELTLPLAEEDLVKIDLYYAPVYLKVYAKGSPDQYLLYTFDLKSEPTPDNLFSTTFVDPENVIDTDKAFIVSKHFESYLDGAYIETSFADDQLYTFIKGENAFETDADVFEYTKEKGIDTPHILVLDKSGLATVNAGFKNPAYYFTKNYNINPVISGVAVNGSDWSGNIGEDEGQFKDDSSVSVGSLIIGSTAESGTYKFYGFTVTGQIKDMTARKKNINFYVINTYINRPTLRTSLFQFGSKLSSLTPELKANRETFYAQNVYIEGNTMTADGAKLFDGTLPSIVILDGIYFNYKTPFAAGIKTYEYNCLSDYRSFQIRNSCFKNYLFKNSFLMKNTQTGKAITANEYAEYVMDGNTFVNTCFNGKSVFAADMRALNLVQITNNKVCNEKFTTALDLVLPTVTTNNNANIPMKLVVTNNYLNAVKAASSINFRTFSSDSVIKDNYAVSTAIKDVSKVTYGGKEIKITGKVDCSSYYVDSELKYYATDGIPATFVGEKTTLTENGAKYLITENDPVITDNGDGTYDIDVSSIVTNPAGNKVEVKIGDVVKNLTNMPLTVEVDDPNEVELTVIGYALQGDNTAERTLLLTSKIAQVGTVTVGGVAADKDGDEFTVFLPRNGEDEEIIVTALAAGTDVEITDEYGDIVTNVDVIMGASATYTITASIAGDVKEYTLYVTRESEDKTVLIANLEALADDVTDAIDAEGDTWLPAAKEILIMARSYAYDAIDDNYNADELAQAYADLEEALADAKATSGVIEIYNEALAKAKAVTNADGKYCDPAFEVYTGTIEFAEEIVEYVSTVEDINSLVETLESAKEFLIEHTYTNYVHDSNSENCSSNGTKTAVCDTEGCTKTHTVEETENYKNDKHEFGEYKYNGDATVEKDGTKTATCKLCGHTDTVTAEGTKLNVIDTSKKFVDVTSNAWYKDYVDYAVTHSLMSGTSDTTFAPVKTITRAEFVQVLANMSNVDTSNNAVETKFSDVKSGAWYAAAVKWAADNGIVSGTSDTTFAPTAVITREQMCVMLVNYAQYKGITLKTDVAKVTFPDDAKISSWAKDAVYACQMAGIVSGKGTGFAPVDTATRSEVTVIVSIFHEDYIK